MTISEKEDYMSVQVDLELENTLRPFLEAACARKATEMVVLDLRGLISFADAFIIMSAASTRQTRAIAEYVRRKMKDVKISPISIVGTAEGQWVLMDYGDVLIHIFHEPVRGFYDLEGLWADAPFFAESLIAEIEKNVVEVPEVAEEEFWEWDDEEVLSDEE